MRARYPIGLLGVATMAAGTLFGTVATASTPRSELVHVYDVNTGGPTGSVVITGAIGDWGSDQTGVAPNANRLTLSKGSVEVDTRAISKAFSHARATFNPKNCGVVLSAKAPANLFNGTGAYQGISGKVFLKITSAAVLPRTSSGKCDMSPNSAALGEVTIDQGSGSVSLP